ncbi:hypothetical protein JCGZ_08213 [Jatropha curcas]|uniref:Uncharacterized protein n=1 Tax=Jatropha curcas TaxID=180498 RepID=A0A067KLB3_JATCU|nr:uncharacterized protein LOC105635342 [Jatropha curcas]KDP36922.1 hypothetical protein JCGZ_08213 [Jatropha curcas]
MGTEKRSQQDKLFDGLVKLIKNQQEQLKTLVDERKILEDCIRIKHERWVSDVRLYEDHLSQIKDSLIEKDMACLVEAAKSDMMIGLKGREAFLYKLKFEQTEDELADFRACFDYLSRTLEKNTKETDNGKEGSGRDGIKSSGSKKLDAEVKRLKLEYEKLASEKQSEISALLKEKSFVWNQYNVLESNLTEKLKSKQAEVDQKNEKIATVLSSVELLQSSNNEKDEMIARLKAKLAEVEADRNKWKEEILTLSQELETLRKSRSAQVTPASRNGNTGAKDYICIVKARGRKGSNIVVKKELSPGKAVVPSKDDAKGSRSLKRKEVDVIPTLGTPKLFTSAFKVPKLKTPSTLR